MKYTSAALGKAFFEYVDGSWQLIQDYSWRSRNTGGSDSAKEERVLFLEQEDWVAANSRMGNPQELEYQLLIAEKTLKTNHKMNIPDRSVLKGNPTGRNLIHQGRCSQRPRLR